MSRSKEFKAVYNAAGVYDQVLLPHHYGGCEDVDLVERIMIEQYGPPHTGRLSIVEFGCGTGRITTVLAPYAKRLVGVDSSYAMIEAFRGRFPTAEAQYLDTRAAVACLLHEGQAGAFDVVAAFWSLSYPLGEYFEEMTAEGVRPVPDPTCARAHASRFVRHLLRLLAPGGHLLAMFFDSETREQQLVTRIWERIAPFPEGGRRYTRELLIAELYAAEMRGHGELTHARYPGVAVARDHEAARRWFNVVHLKGMPALVNDPATQEDIDGFLAGCTHPSGEIHLPTGVHVIDFEASADTHPREARG